MIRLTRRVQCFTSCLRGATAGLSRSVRTEAGPNRRRSRAPAFQSKKAGEKSDWWIVDGEMHEIGENVPPRERFVIPRDNIPNKRRKQLREQFMHRTRLVLKESEHEPWCRRYMELYQELRENWERLYWDEGYSKKIASDHANYESAEDDDQDFNPHRIRRSDQMKAGGSDRNRQGDNWERADQVRDKFEYDRDRRMREKAFAPMNRVLPLDQSRSNPRNQPLDRRRYFLDETN
ncbi:unnamed protein product [Linum tenue]|uniref:Uncharacterized protein n=1 Tax=Linum tenue TaxID=586396 RepID=A0AAV0RRI7_9ROSI|nr:unnamed protein product [Linum tenue]